MAPGRVGWIGSRQITQTGRCRRRPPFLCSAGRPHERRPTMRGAGRVVFAAVLLLIAGTLNIIYGIGGISDANFYTSNGTHYVVGTLHTWGWVTLILGIIQLTAGFSLFSGGTYGRVIGIIGGSLGALGA